jgi:hypothetical protein
VVCLGLAWSKNNGINGIRTATTDGSQEESLKIPKNLFLCNLNDLSSLFINILQTSIVISTKLT